MSALAVTLTAHSTGIVTYYRCTEILRQLDQKPTLVAPLLALKNSYLTWLKKLHHLRGGWEEITIPGSRQDGLYKVQNLTPHVRYCATMAVRNPTGLGPFSEELCNTTTSARKS